MLEGIKIAVKTAVTANTLSRSIKVNDIILIPESAPVNSIPQFSFRLTRNLRWNAVAFVEKGGQIALPVAASSHTKG